MRRPTTKAAVERLIDNMFRRLPSSWEMVEMPGGEEFGAAFGIRGSQTIN